MAAGDEFLDDTLHLFEFSDILFDTHSRCHDLKRGGKIVADPLPLNLLRGAGPTSIFHVIEGIPVL
jgi:hypothetical protein